MSTVIDRQVEAYSQSVREARPDIAPQFGRVPGPSAFVEVLQDLIDVGLDISRHLVRGVTARPAGRIPPEAASRFTTAVRGVVASMASVQRLCDVSIPAGVELRDRNEFDDAVVELRLLMADLQGDAAGFTPPPPPSDAERERMREEFSRLAQIHPPRQSWFEEDHTKLVGPGKS